MDKKTKVKLIIGVAIMIVLVIGATYAYFNMGVINNSTSSVITLQTEESGLVTLSVPTPNLKIIVDEEDMAPNNARNYYADDEKNYVLTEEEGTHTITKFEITDATNEDKYECTADITVTMTNEEGSMGAALQQGDLYLHLKGDGSNDFPEETLDLYTIKDEGTKTYSGITFKVTGNSSSKIDAYAYLVNKKDAEQDHLANKELNITISAGNLKCGEDKGAKLVKKLQDDDTNNTLSDDLVGGMYRYQGTNDEVNNYFCFEGKCSSGSDDMYRIIGITPEGSIKLIKQTKFINNGTSTYAWNTDYQDSTCGDDGCPEWPESDVYKILNEGESSFLSTLNADIQNKIEPQKWWYGDMHYSFVEELVADQVYQIETGQMDTKYYGHSSSNKAEVTNQRWTQMENKANIGLIYLHDYYYQANQASCHPKKNSDYANCINQGWMNMRNNGGAESGNEAREWTMSRIGRQANSSPYFSALSVSETGNIASTDLLVSYAVRPVFYLKSNITLYGSGTLDDPYTLSEVIPTEQENYLRKNEEANNSTALSKTLVGGMYRYQGADTLKGKKVNNYICLEKVEEAGCSNAKTNGYDDNMYRIIGITESGNIKVIKQTQFTNKGISKYVWNTKNDETTSIPIYKCDESGCPEWPKSEIYNTLNGTFYSSLNENIKNKIQEWNWWYGDIEWNYANKTAEEIYKIEIGQADTQYYGKTSSSKDLVTGKRWTGKIGANIGLIYLHDYYYQSTSDNCHYNGSKYEACKTGGWMHISKNGGSSSDYEWTMSRAGRQSDSSSSFEAWRVDPGGYVNRHYFNVELSIRPVFYLKNDIVLKGSGTYDDPFYIES